METRLYRYQPTISRQVTMTSKHRSRGEGSMCHLPLFSSFVRSKEIWSFCGTSIRTGLLLQSKLARTKRCERNASVSFGNQTGSLICKLETRTTLYDVQLDRIHGPILVKRTCICTRYRKNTRAKTWKYSNIIDC